MVQGKEEWERGPLSFLFINDEIEKGGDEKYRTVSLEMIKNNILEEMIQRGIGVKELSRLAGVALESAQKVKGNFEEIEIDALNKILDVLGLNLKIKISID